MVKKSKITKKSDLSKKNSMSGKKAIGDFDETFREVPIFDMGHRSQNIAILKPLKNGKDKQTDKDHF